MGYVMCKKSRIKIGYQNAAIYNFSSGEVYLVNQNIAEKLCRGDFSDIDTTLIAKLCTTGLISADERQGDAADVMRFEYDLFDDSYSYKKCKLVYLEVTDVCNYHCLHCYANISPAASTFMPFMTAEKYIKQIASLGECDVRVTGGEPFLNKSICKILEAIQKMVTPITKHSVVTNGSFDYNDALYALQLGFELQISIYGINSDKFCYFTKATNYTYERVYDNLIKLSKSPYRDQIVLLFSVNALSYNDMDKFVDIANGLGFRYFFNRPASVGRAAINWEQLQLPEDIQRSFARSQRNPVPYFCYHLCQLHWTSIMVNGDVTPCGFLRDANNVIGNLNDECLASIWESYAYTQFRKLSANDVEYCRDCEFEYMCTAGCCGETLSYTGDMLKSYCWCLTKPFRPTPYLRIADNEMYLVEKSAAGIFDFVKI